MSRALLCASLLAAGRPLSDKELAKVANLPPTQVEAEIAALQIVLNEADLGLVVEAVAGGYRLVVHPNLVPALTDLLAPPPLPPLSNAALETLAIVAYKQPVTRGEIEAARGASCVSTLETLQERELIKIVGRKDVVGQPHLYATTERFLLEFGLKSLGDLPALESAPAALLRG